MKAASRLSWLLTLSTLGAFSPGTVYAQSEPTAVRRAAISIFGGISRVSPGYSSDTNYGAMVGADFTRYFRLVSPSLELRYTDSSGNIDGESTLQAGLKLEKDFGRYRPYGELGIGYGSITFQHPAIFPTGPYSSDSSFVYVGGGGLDYKLSSTVALKLDLQAQSWKLGTEGSRFTPVAATVGVSIMLPFQGLSRRR